MIHRSAPQWSTTPRLLSRYSHAVQAVRGLFEAVPLPQVVVDLTVLYARVRRLAARGDLPHGDTERPLGDQKRNRQSVNTGREEHGAKEGERREGEVGEERSPSVFYCYY